MYEISSYSGKIKHVESGIIFNNDSTDENYNDYYLWLSNEGTPIYVYFFEGEETQYNRRNLPKVVSQRQLRTQLRLNGFDLNDVQTVIDSLPEPNKTIAQVAWDYAITFELESPLLRNLAYALGMTDEDVDNIFINASQL